MTTHAQIMQCLEKNLDVKFFKQGQKIEMRLSDYTKKPTRHCHHRIELAQAHQSIDGDVLLAKAIELCRKNLEDWHK